ncbi:MAG: hypothetical protein KF896_15755 [Ignavibacteriae bacterium]|nr:hypothetical protein [Ignavibacteriota bacterium]
MTNNVFNEFLDKQLLKRKMVLSYKADEYAVDNDRFHNFNIAVDILKHVGIIDTPAKVAFCFRVKHIVSEIDLLNGTTELTEDIIEEKFGDDINYAFMQQGMLFNQLKEDQNEMPKMRPGET